MKQRLIQGTQIANCSDQPTHRRLQFMLWFPLSVERKRCCFLFLCFFPAGILGSGCVMAAVHGMHCLRKFSSQIQERGRENLLDLSPQMVTKYTFLFLLHTTIAASKARLITNHSLIVREHTESLFCHGFPRLLIVRRKKYTLIAHSVGHTSPVFPHCLLTPYLGNVFHDIDKAF